MFVLGSHQPTGTPDGVVVESDPARLLERVQEANRGGDVHLVGGPRTIEAFRGRIPPAKSLNLEIAALYWHFVDVVWVVIFPVVYLIK